MQHLRERFYLIDFIIITISTTVILFVISDFPDRNVFKEAVSLVTLFAFTLMLTQFFSVQMSRGLFQITSFSAIARLHKVIGYIVIPLFLIHPFLIVAHKAYEPGQSFKNALITLLTSLETSGLIAGMAAWIVMLIIGVTSMFRKKFGMKHSAWRLMHGIFSLVFILPALWHVIDMGRHINNALSIFLLFLGFSGTALLLGRYYRRYVKE